MLTAQVSEGSKVWEEFDTTWKRTKKEFFAFLYGYPSQRICGPWEPIESDVLQALYCSKILGGSYLSEYDLEILNTYIREGGLKKGYAKSLRDKGLLVAINEDHLRIHLRALVAGDLNQTIRKSSR